MAAALASAVTDESAVRVASGQGRRHQKATMRTMSATGASFSLERNASASIASTVARLSRPRPTMLCLSVLEGRTA